MDVTHQGYEVVVEPVVAGGRTWSMQRLKNRAQFYDPDGEAAAMGVHENVWPIFGILWPTSAGLLDALADIDFTGQTVLEIGCGLGLVSLALHDRGVRIIASDIHPLAEQFLRENASLNGVAEVPFQRLDWTRSYPDLPPIHAFIASDVLYEDGMDPDIVRFIDQHAAPSVRVFMVDPGRAGRRNAFTRAMEAAGFTTREWQPDAEQKARIMTYTRGVTTL